MDDDLESEGSPPSCPQALEVTAVEATSATLKWKEPKKDGGAPIKEYVIEFKSNNEGEEWQEREDRVKPKKYLTEASGSLWSEVGLSGMEEQQSAAKLIE